MRETTQKEISNRRFPTLSRCVCFISIADISTVAQEVGVNVIYLIAIVFFLDFRIFFQVAIKAYKKLIQIWISMEVNYFRKIEILKD